MSARHSSTARPSARRRARPVLALDLGAQPRSGRPSSRPTGASSPGAKGRTPGADGPDAVVAACIAHLRGVRDGRGVGDRERTSRRRPLGAGPGRSAGGHARRAAQHRPRLPGRPVRRPHRRALGLPAALERDTHVAALARARPSARRRGCADFLYLTVSTGLRRRDRGRRAPLRRARRRGRRAWPPRRWTSTGRSAAAVAGATSRPSAPAAGSSRLATAAAAAGRRSGGARRPPRLARAAGRWRAGTSPRLPTPAIPSAMAIMDRARRAFAALAVGLVNTFAPERIVVGGGLAEGAGRAPARARSRGRPDDGLQDPRASASRSCRRPSATTSG